MCPLVLFQPSQAGIKVPFVLPASVHELPYRNAHRALIGEWPPPEGKQPKLEHIRSHGGGRGPAEANVLRLQKSRKAKHPLKTAVGQASGQLRGFSNQGKPKGLEQQKRSKTKSTGAGF
jgi:hypothetical protein